MLRWHLSRRGWDDTRRSAILCLSPDFTVVTGSETSAERYVSRRQFVLLDGIWQSANGRIKILPQKRFGESNHHIDLQMLGISGPQLDVSIDGSVYATREDTAIRLFKAPHEWQRMMVA